MTVRAAAAIAPPPVGPRARTAIAVGCGLVLAACGSTGAFLPYSALGPGLDPSFVFALGRLPSLPDVVPGRDWVYTYGPLAHLLVPPARGGTIYVAAALRILAHLSLVTLVVVAGRRKPRSMIAATLGWLAAVALGLDLPGALVLLCALLWTVPGRGESARWCVAAALVAPLAFVRTNLAIATLAMLATSLLVRVVSRRDRESSSKALVAPCAAALAAGAACVWVLFPTAADFLAWCGGQLEITAGYGAAMALPGDAGVLAAGAAALPVGAAILLVAWRRRWGSFGWWAVLAGPVVLAFRHSFVRQDDHMLILFPFLVAAASLGLLFADVPRESATAATAAALALAGGLYGVQAREQTFDPLVALARRAQDWQSLLDARATVSRYRQLDQQNLAPQRLPGDFVAPLREPGVETDAIPWELSLIAANDLAWRPNPTLQLYSAYTERLDARAAAHFASERAPEALLVHFGRVDGRNPLWDTPVTLRAILGGYRFDAVAPDRALVLLRRRPVPARWVREPAGTIAAPLGEWLPVPETPAGFDYLFAEIAVPPSPLGRLETVLLRTAPLSAELELEDGSRRTFRLVPGTLPGGILLSPAPRGIEAFARIARGETSPRTARLRLLPRRGPPAWSDATIRLVAARLEHHEEADRVAAP